RVLMLNSLVFALGLVCLALAQGPVGLFAGWCILGMAMAAGLYEAAFATLVHLYGQRSRGPITGITLMAGLASTIGWPLSAWLELHWGWRTACMSWAALHLLVGLPLNALPLLALVFAVTWFISTAMAAHLPRLLQAQGLPLATALLLAALVGPAQVAGRLLEYGLLRRLHPVASARVAGALHSVGAIAFLLLGVPAGAAFTLLHGAGNGILTIAKGTLPLVLFGTKDYGLRQGLLMVPARFAQALSPYVFGLAIDRFGGGALWFSAALGAVGFMALMLLPGPSPRAPASP
ncbi:MAG: MFS transporter, partial [Polaromonas sp.]|nr:MFS transporter [Polaromonas sp.]